MYNDDFSPPSYSKSLTPPKVICWSCNKELVISFCYDFYAQHYTSTYSCCMKTETLTITNDAIDNNRVPSSWIAFLTKEARIK